ncbi:DUF2854 domain-containing protein [filamentous cyanobacterium LEGE 11480]|uniref:DUF2854 domain-containing protein n=1 Tax=Romeriopsis navalis LEGE 11480 TaxID=2777977 RepID=A0A928VNL6_9CYAN|nr:DUF2854 domain-containing protein [Romeriopsis navalis]MBE9030912.1 DUF2854 domain-containing protein [Romeriopsis navalis LEGE 11480]
MLRQIRWAVLLLSVGSVLGFVGGVYYLHQASIPSAIATLVGVPMALVGLGLKGAELSPLTLPAPTPEIEALRLKSTATQAQILEDVTRYQYGATVHLEVALERLGIESEETDEHPPLLGIREANVDGAYALLLAFGLLDDFTFDMWKEREEALTRFFGPDVKVEVSEPDDGKEYVKVAIVATA